MCVCEPFRHASLFGMCVGMCVCVYGKTGPTCVYVCMGRQTQASDIKSTMVGSTMVGSTMVGEEARQAQA